MAKETGAVAMPEIKPTVEFYDIKGEPPDISVGESVTVHIRGRVSRISMSEDKDKRKSYSATIEYRDVEFMKGKKGNEEMSEMEMNEYAKHRNKAD